MTRPLPPALVALWLAGGCAEPGSPDAYLPPSPRACGSDLDCTGERGEICRRPDGTGSPVADADAGVPVWDGICVIRSARSSAEIFLEIRPTADAALPTAQVGPVRLSAGQNQELVLPPPATVAGSVSYAGASPRPVPRARVRFRSRGLIPGRPLLFEAETGAHGAEAGQFTRVLPSDAFSVLVVPPDVQVGERLVGPPPERPLGDAYTDVLIGTRTLSFEISGTDELVRVSGAAVDRDGAPVEGIEVWAVDSRPGASPPRPSGPRLGARPLCQPVRTDAAGRFTLWLPRVAAGREPHRVQLRLGPPADTDFPSYAPAETWEITGSLELPPLVLERVRERVQLRGVVRGRFVPTTLRVSTVDRESVGYETLATVDGSGAFMALVPPGIYVAAAQPDLRDGGLAVCASRGEFRADGSAPIQLECPQPGALSGRIIGPRGEPVPNVLVNITRRPDVLTRDLRSDQTVSDEDGYFRFSVGEGTYDFALHPAPDSRLPFQLLRNIQVAAGRPDSLLVVELGAPFELFGRLLLGALGAPVAASLEAYVVDPETNEALLVGRGLSKADGSYSIVVPAATR